MYRSIFRGASIYLPERDTIATRLIGSPDVLPSRLHYSKVLQPALQKCKRVYPKHIEQVAKRRSCVTSLTYARIGVWSVHTFAILRAPCRRVANHTTHISHSMIDDYKPTLPYS
jgi:hypothetical protein